MLKTWDIFDTLIARRCIIPAQIFQIVEESMGSTGFVQARLVAAQNVHSRGEKYTFDDIYDELQKITGVDANTCERFKQREIEVEIDQCIPITENLQQVKSGDILVSDMYLPESVIRKMLMKAGLFVPVEIVITNDGKATGRIWKEFVDEGQFVFHIGDNITSDIKNSRLVGLDSAITLLSNPNDIEQFLIQKDFPFACYLREMRLRNPFTEEIKRFTWLCCVLNVGLLIIFVRLIDELAKKYDFEYLGFCGRDTYYLCLLYRKYKQDIGEEPLSNDYLYYSRKLTYTSLQETADYFSSRINNRKALMIDLHASGMHFCKLRAVMKMPFSILAILIAHTSQVKHFYDNVENIVLPENWIAFLNNPPDTLPSYEENFYFFEGRNDVTEVLNRATHNTPIKLGNVNVGDKIIPNVIFSEINDSENLDVLETCIKEVLNSRVVYGGGGG